MNIDELEHELDRLAQTAITPEQKRDVEKYRIELSNMRKQYNEKDELEREKTEEYIVSLENIAKSKFGAPIVEKTVDPAIEIQRLEALQEGDFDPDIFAHKMEKLRGYKNEIRLELSLPPIPKKFITNAEIEKLVIASSVDDFCKVNKPLRQRIFSYIDEKSAVQRFLSDKENFKMLIHDEREQLRQKPSEFVRSTDRKNRVNISVNPLFTVWEKSIDTLNKKVDSKIKAVRSLNQDKKMNDSDKSYLGHLEKFSLSLETMREQGKQLNISE